jgi:hypothetical protein
MIRFRAHFDGQHLSPDEPVNLPTDTPLEVTVREVAPQDSAGTFDLGKWLASIEGEVGLFDGPEDLSVELDHYLYGGPKRSEMDGA